MAELERYDNESRGIGRCQMRQDQQTNRPTDGQTDQRIGARQDPNEFEVTESTASSHDPERIALCLAQ